MKKMIYKMITMYGNMEDPEEFYYFYRDTIVPKLLSLPGVLKMTVNRLFNSPFAQGESENQDKPKYHVMGQLYLSDVEQFMEAFQYSDVGKTITSFLAYDARDFATVYTAIEEVFEN